ncbi:MAG: hypothetical protein LBB80_09580 [Treponema sp.]|jgi:xylulokinase/glycerol kinase|nr:hypothetical protein [Treponema sp.]
MNILVIDIGTSSMRGILFSDTGEKLFSTQVQYQARYISKEEIEQNVCDWQNAVTSIVKNIVETSKSVDAIAVSAQRSSIIAVDKDGSPLIPAIMWQDRRAADICRELEAHNRTIFERSGAKVNLVFSGCKMAWIKRNKPEIYNKVYKFVNIPEYIFYYMTGEYNTDHTYGSRSNLMNLRERKWDKTLLDLFNITEDFLCVLNEPGSIVGKTRKKFSSLTGLQAGVPVITTGGDQQCAALGQGVYKEGVLSVVLGTGGYLVTHLETVPPDLKEDLICNCAALPNKYILEANILTCSSAFDWFYRNFYDSGKTTIKMLDEELEHEYRKENSSIVLPFFQGRTTPDWNSAAKAVFANISLSTTRSELLTSLIEGICLKISNNIRLIRQYTDIKQVVVSGGLSNSKIINQIFSDVTGLKLVHLENTESTSIGALITALCAFRIFDNPEQAFSKLRGNDVKDEFVPNDIKTANYTIKQQEVNELYNRIYKSV